jgi:hypothetical protein
MLAYLLIAGHAGAPVDPELIARFDQDDPPEIPFHSEERVIWRNRDNSVVFLGWQAFTEVAGIGSHWTIAGDSLTAFTGHCWPLHGGWAHTAGRSWAERLQAYLRDIPDPRIVREALFGQFTIISLPAVGTGWALPDWAGADQLFTGDDAGATVISNRAGLCARAMTRGGAVPARSPLGAGWLIGEGWMLDRETSYWDVERSVAGSAVVIEPHVGARIIEPACSPLLPPIDEPPASTYEELLDEAERDLRAVLRAVADLPLDDRVLSLSGGKDSRTLLAIVLDEGLAHRFRYATYGSPERADAIVAKSIATRYGLDWTLIDLAGRTPEAELENARIHAWTSEGLTNAWAIIEQPRFAPGATVMGFAGEGLRWGSVSGSGIGATTATDVVTALGKKRPIDPLHILQSGVRDYYTAIVKEWIQNQTDLGVPAVSLPTIYKQEHLIHSRNGPDTSWNPRMRISPYLIPSCMRSNHRLPVNLRPDPRFHLDLQRRSTPALSKMPFVGPPWTEAAFAHLPDAGEYRGIESISTVHAIGQTWRQKRYAEYLPLIEPILYDPGNPVRDLLDIDRLTKRVANGALSAGRIRLIWGALTAAIWLGHGEQPAKIGRHSDVATSGFW